MAHTDRRCCSPAGHRAVALLDVDHTTLFGIVGFDDASLQLNDAMLRALRDRGVRDAFFFTDMTLSTASVGVDRSPSCARISIACFSFTAYAFASLLSGSNRSSSCRQPFKGPERKPTCQDA